MVSGRLAMPLTLPILTNRSKSEAEMNSVLCRMPWASITALRMITLGFHRGQFQYIISRISDHPPGTGAVRP
jgi:hypothetical protein